MSTPTLPKAQKAIIFNTKTNILSLKLDHCLPLINPTSHLIRVHSTAITNGELTWAPFTDWPVEHVPCYDVSGTIIIPAANSKFKEGERVYGRIYAQREGAAAEYASLLDSETARVPGGLTMEEAASVPMSGLTAWQALFEPARGNLSYPNEPPYVNNAGELLNPNVAAGKKILILGAADAVGAFAVQLAKLAGAYVVGTASGRNESFLRGVGIDEVIDYTKTSIQEYIVGQEDRKFDFVFDCVGGKSMLDGWHAVKSHGAYVSIVPGFEEEPKKVVRPENVRSGFFVMDSRGEELEQIGRFIEKGLVKTGVDSVWKIEKYREAFERTGTGHARGKVVFRVAWEE
ncbi:NAD(P)-binding protein [Delitschia confertaspora ATCC 74209]|uniref:NAD(P)-binding protein n=1 Tax=Delitschia confertaspora ATCC 74209 TaxID=1513339 RepID=A0A9P4JS22_9PLEO|nr:NAD(P)-binding protein [Delitschia confertaspora ATCC 74209]